MRGAEKNRDALSGDTWLDLGTKLEWLNSSVTDNAF
jgi:hypothetical protein